jgi:hypothetical protein
MVERLKRSNPNRPARSCNVARQSTCLSLQLAACVAVWRSAEYSPSDRPGYRNAVSKNVSLGEGLEAGLEDRIGSSSAVSLSGG